MGWLVRFLLPMPLVRPLLKPITRFLVGALAIPLFRIFLRRVVRLQELDRELEKDLEQWFRASLLLLVATANMEHLLFDWVPLDFQDEHAWIGVAFRIMLAIGVIESMPDQALFAIIHPGPPAIKLKRGVPCFGLKELCWPYIRGLLCQHLNRSSPVLAIMAAIFGGDPEAARNPVPYEHWVVGWSCYGLAIVQYLIIGLVTSRDKALDALAEFDRQIAVRRQELIDEFAVDNEVAAERKRDDGAKTLKTGESSPSPIPIEPSPAASRVK